MQEREPVAHLNVYDLLMLLARWRKLFIVNFLVVVLVAVVVAYSLPIWFTAQTVILPPAGSGGGLPGFLSKDLVGAATSFGLELPTEDIYQTILNSRSLKERMIERFHLRDIYGLGPDVKPEDVLRVFGSHYKVTTREDISIEVTVEDRDAARAAEMANACVEELDNVFSSITSLTARNNRIFIGKRLAEINDSLAVLQDSLSRFQKEHNAVSLSDQITAMIGAAADLKAQQMATDIRLGVLRHSLGESHPSVMQLESTGKAMLSRYEAVLAGREGELFPSLQQLPELTRQLADLVRRTRIQISLQDFVYPQFENARIQEVRESANVQVLDPARVPSRKARPPRRLIVTLAAAASLLVTLVGVLLAEYWRRLPEKNHADWSKVEEIRRILKGGR